MITRIREVRKAKRMTLEDVARSCQPPTTPQTIGRLETGTRTVSIGWLNRIAAALGVTAADLVEHPDRGRVDVLALLSADGPVAPRRQAQLVAPTPGQGQVAIVVTGSVGEYRTGDELWCDHLSPEEFGRALNRDVMVPRPAGRFLFGRLLARDGGKLHLQPPEAGARQVVVAEAAWAALPVKLIRTL